MQQVMLQRGMTVTELPEDSPKPDNDRQAEKVLDNKDVEMTGSNA